MSTPFQTLCQDYLAALRDAQNNPNATDELSLRPALDEFLKKAAVSNERPVAFISEGKKLVEGRPDFVLTTNGLPVGYIEAEKPSADLDKLTGHSKSQNERFIANLDNFLLTNHLDFRLYSGGVLVGEASLPAPPEKGAPVVPEAKADKLEALLDQLMKAAPLPIKAPRDLALHLARRARQMRDQVRDLFREDNAKAGLLGAYQAFQSVLLPDLKPFLSDEDRRKPKRPHSFDDLFAQTIAYSLFAARCSHPGGSFGRQNAASLIETNPFLQQLFGQFLLQLPPSLDWIVDEMAALLNAAPMEEIAAYFYKRTGREDPMIDFYEPFLQFYDAALREVRGVYYTPVPVVSYIVRSLHFLLQDKLGRPDGLADKNTLILDPATGTGSFLFAAIDEIRAHVVKSDGSGAWPGYVETNLLNRVFGFELLMAPYAIAHLKLGLQLAGGGAKVPDGERFGIYLTNTLDDAVKQSNLLMGQFISDEANAAVKVKTSDPILVVLGNPPYSGHSSNPSRNAKGELTQIGRLIEGYKMVDGQPLGERNSKWLQDDYVKFIAFAQERLRKTGEGSVGYITNHAFLDNPTFRGMRQSLMETFSYIYILNLHGNSKKKEVAPSGGADQNVFAIQQGVSIFIGLKEKGNDTPARVQYADLWGYQKAKYEALFETDISTTAWEELKPVSPFYFFVPLNTDLLPDYQRGWKVTDVFLEHSIGIVTGQDSLTIAFSTEETKKLAETHNLPYSTVRAILYRPFDVRRIVYDNSVIERRREKVMRHMFNGENLGFLAKRQSKREPFSYIWCANLMVESCVFESAYANNTLLPLYLLPETDDQKSTDSERRPNLSPAFLAALREKLALPAEGEFGLPQGVSPENIFHYAYAVFHAPSYRALYGEFLKSDFPRLPLTSDRDLFFDLARLGRELVALHLLDEAEAPVLKKPGHPFEGVGNGKVERAKVKWNGATRRVKINETQGFEEVSEEVWEFRVGGYQVAEKWLKDRDGRALSLDDQRHYRRVLTALAETSRFMGEIDARIPGWPLV